MLTVFLVLVIIAIILTVAAAWAPSKMPLWAAVFVLCLIELLRIVPLGK